MKIALRWIRRYQRPTQLNKENKLYNNIRYNVWYLFSVHVWRASGRSREAVTWLMCRCVLAGSGCLRPTSEMMRVICREKISPLAVAFSASPGRRRQRINRHSPSSLSLPAAATVDAYRHNISLLQTFAAIILFCVLWLDCPEHVLKCWNRSSSVTASQTLGTFRRRLKTHIFAVSLT